MTILLMLSALAAEPTFPERTPGLIRACIDEALASDTVSKTNGTYKYICGGDVALDFWNYLENAEIVPWEQSVEEGLWLSRNFPLGGCFKRIRNPDGSPATNGLSCTIWIPYRVRKEPK